MPLLHVGPDGMIGRNGNRRQWKEQSVAADFRVARDVVLGGLLDEWRRAFQRFGVSFLTVGMVKENSVSGADGGLAVAERIPRQTRCAAPD